MFSALFFGTAVAVLVPIANAGVPFFGPRPTDPPSPAVVEARLQGLRKRASDDVLYWTMATDQTCGYLSGDESSAITCEDDTLTCIWHAASGTETFGDIGCTESGLYTAHWYCLDYESATDTDQFSYITNSADYILRCTDTSAPYCKTYAYPNRVTDYRCVSESQLGASKAFWTYDGQNEKEAGFVTEAISSDATESDTTFTDAITSTSSAHTSTTASSSPSTEPPHSKTPVGPIVGGVVGGLAVVALFVLGVLFLLRRKRKSNSQNGDGAAAQTDPSQAPVSAVDTKSPMTMPVSPSPADAMSQSDWRGSSVVSPRSPLSPQSPYAAPTPHHQAELDANPPVYSNTVHELS